MKAYVILVMMLAMTIFIIGDARAVTDSIPPKDQPNFHPKITKEEINEKNLEVVEFQCKLAK